MIDDDDIETGPGGFRQRQMRRRAAINGHDDPNPLFAQTQQGRSVGAIALMNPIGHVGPAAPSDGGKEAREQGGRSRTVDIVIAKDADRFAIAHGPDQPRRRRLHVDQMRRIGEQVAQARREEPRRVIAIDPALRQ